MTRPKYSIALPTLNGGETLSVTLPAMLQIDRDDVEWVISNNLSEDDTKDVVLGFDDKRIRYVEPPERLHHSRHLEFAYTNATGLWQGHMGDDDILFPSRFDVLDEVMKNTDAMVIRGGNLRYHWPEYPVPEQANHIDPCAFNGALYEMSARDFVTNQINDIIIYGGASWAVHRSIIDKVRHRCGHFVSPRNVEFFAMRAAAAASNKIALLGLPIYVLGRHSGSTGSQALYPKNEATRNDWDWKLEFPEPWPHCPFNYHGYAPISLDAAMGAAHHFPEIKEYVDLRWDFWLQRVHADIERLIRVGRLPENARSFFDEGMAKLPEFARRQWELRKSPDKLAEYNQAIDYRPPTPAPPLPTSDPQNNPGTTAYFGWPRSINGDDVGVRGIVDVPRWVENTYGGFFASRTVPF